MRKVLLFLLTATLAFGQAGRPPVNNLNQIPTRRFTDLQDKPTTVAGYGITDVPLVANIGQTAVADTGNQTTGAGTIAGDTSQNLFSVRDNSGSGSYVRSTTNILAVQGLDVTCLAVYSGSLFHVTLVSPRHVIYAWHIGLSNGTTIRFVTNTNTIVSRTLTAHQQVGSTDIGVGLLDSDVPSTITPVKVLPNPSVFTQTRRAVFYVDQNLKVYVADNGLTSNNTFGGITPSIYASRFSFYHTLVGFDSSSPAFFALDGQLILLGCFQTSSTYPSLGYNYSAVNTTLTSLGGGYQLTPYLPILPTPQPPPTELVPSQVYDANKKPIFNPQLRQFLDSSGNALGSWGDTANTINIYDTTTLKIGADTVLVGDALSDFIAGIGLSRNDDNLSELADFTEARNNLGLGTAATKNTGTASGNVPVLDGAGKLNTSTLPAAAQTFKGVWNANTNSPTIVSSTGTLGWFYLVSVAGATSIDGLSSWAVGDQIIFDGSVWKQVPAAASVTSVAGHTGAVTLAASDIASGTMATARLGSGTASNKTVLYGDQTYKFPQQFYDSAGTPKLALDSAVRKLYGTDGTTVLAQYDGISFFKVINIQTIGGHSLFDDSHFSIIGSDGNSQINLEPGSGNNGITLYEAVAGNVIFHVDSDTGQTTIGGNTADSGKLSLFNPAGTFTVTIAADNVTANRTIQEPNASGTHALTSDLPTFAANMATFIATPTSANLRATVTDEDGTGALMFVGSTVYQPRPVVTTVAFSSTVTPAVGTINATTTYIIGALTNNITIGAPTGTPTDGQVLKFRFLQDSTGGRTVTWNSAFVFGTDITAAMEPTAANSVWRRAFEYNAATSKWECVGLVRGF